MWERFRPRRRKAQQPPCPTVPWSHTSGPRGWGIHILIHPSCFLLGRVGHATFTGALLQIVAQLPFRYGLSSAETAISHVFCRVQAFTSQAAPASGTSFLRVGEPVVGFIEPTNRQAHSAQLTGWDRTSLDEWRTSSPASFPVRFDLNKQAIFDTPQLSALGFSYLRPPKCNVLKVETPVQGPAFAQASSPGRSSRGRSRARKGPRDPKVPSWHGEPASASETLFPKAFPLPSPEGIFERVLCDAKADIKIRTPFVVFFPPKYASFKERKKAEGPAREKKREEEKLKT